MVAGRAIDSAGRASTKTGKPLKKIPLTSYTGAHLEPAPRQQHGWQQKSATARHHWSFGLIEKMAEDIF